MTSGYVFDIQNCSMHDGPGLRTTVFFKGCPLRCLWCANPESQLQRPQVMFYAINVLDAGNVSMYVNQEQSQAEKDVSDVEIV